MIARLPAKLDVFGKDRPEGDDTLRCFFGQSAFPTRKITARYGELFRPQACRVDEKDQNKEQEVGEFHLFFIYFRQFLQKNPQTN